MSRRSSSISPASRDGTSQRSRELAALDPAYAPIDERTTPDLLAFVKAYADQIVYFTGGDAPGAPTATGTWGDLVARDDVSIADMIAYIADPAGYGGDRARWLARPHFVLLLTFVELLRHARDSVNDFTRRHLEHFYRELLELRVEPPAADRVNVIFGLSPSATEHLVAEGTELDAGRDSNGVRMVYKTERDLVVNRADIAGSRSVFVDRRITGIPDVRTDRNLTASSAFDRTLAIALGSPKPGDPVPPWSGKPVDTALFVSLHDLLAFSTTSLHLEHYELREMMQLVGQRGPAADQEWAQINKLLGVTDLSTPRDFMANLKQVVGVLDFTADGLPQVKSVDDLYTYRTDPDVRAYIDTKLKPIGFDNFVALMQIKLRIDAEWKQINLLLERAGRRLLRLLEWTLPPGDPTAFDANLALALATAWPPPWPFGTTSIDGYDAMLRDLEQHVYLPVERIALLVAFAQRLGKDASAEAHDWSDVDVLLADAYRERQRAARQAELAAVRNGARDVPAFDATANYVLGNNTPESWNDAKQSLASHLDASQLDLLSRFRDGIAGNDPIYGFGWSDADRLFELASRDVQGLPEPVAQDIEIHNVYAYDDATQVRSSASANGWETFGGTPGFDASKPAGAIARIRAAVAVARAVRGQAHAHVDARIEPGRLHAG